MLGGMLSHFIYAFPCIFFSFILMYSFSIHALEFVSQSLSMHRDGRESLYELIKINLRLLIPPS